MGKLVKKFSVIVACLSLVLGVVGVGGSTVAKASVNSDPIIMQNIYKENNNTIVIAKVKVLNTQYVNYGVDFVCTNGDASTAKTYHVSAKSGTVPFSDGNSATVELVENGDYYLITFTISKDTIASGARGYFYSGSASATNGGYGYFLLS